MPISDIQTSFAAGELSPNLYGRVDLDKYQVGAALIRNFTVNYQGGVSFRPGTKFIADVSDMVVDNISPRLLPFIVSTQASYVLVFGNLQVKIYSSGLYVTTVVTPYTIADLALLKYTQSADVLTLVHPSYPPANLTRTSDTTFSYAVIAIGPTIAPPVITFMRAPHNSTYMYGYVVTAVDLDGKEESLPSNNGVKLSLVLNEAENQVIGIEWTPPAEPVSRYNIYKWGPVDLATMVANTTWGFVGTSLATSFTDNNIAADYTKQPPVWGDPFSGGQFASIRVTAGGAGYATTGNFPDIPFVPLVIVGDGTGAAGYAVLDNASGKIVGVFLTSSGKDYTSATVTAVGQGGAGATFAFTFTDIDPLNPGCTAYVQQRRVFGGSNDKPETLVMSQPGLYNNFNITPVALDTDAITLSIAGEEVNTIKSLVPVAYGLLAFTTGGSYLINGGAQFGPITPASVNVQAQSSIGSNDLIPLRINTDVLYCQDKGNRIRNLAFAWQKQSYQGSDISALASHLFDGFVTEQWSWAQEPFKIVWAVRDDGKLLTLTYVPDQEVYAWARHDTQGFFTSVCSVPEANVNATYVIVKRYVPVVVGSSDPCVGTGGYAYYLERFDDRSTDFVELAWYLDCALRQPLTPGPSEIYIDVPTGTGTMHVCESGVIHTLATSLNRFSVIGKGYFDYTLPGGYTPGDDISVSVTLNNTGDGTTSGTLTNVLYAFGVTIDGGPITDAALSVTHNTFAPGQDIVYYVNQQRDPTLLTTLQWLGATLSPAPFNNISNVPVAAGTATYSLTIPGHNKDRGILSSTQAGLVSLPNTVGGGTTKDGSLFGGGVAGEGYFAFNSSLGSPGVYNAGTINMVEILAPTGANIGTTVGGTPYPGFGGIVAGTKTFNPGDTISIVLGAYFHSNTFGQFKISSIEVDAGAGPESIDLTTVKRTTNPLYNPPIVIESVTTVDPGTTYPIGPFYLLTTAVALLGVGDVVVINGARVRVDSIIDPNNYNVTILGDLSAFLVPNDPNNLMRYIAASEWAYTTPISVATGYEHLEGKEVYALVDGEVQGPFTVDNSGDVTLTSAGSVILVGLLYQGQVQTLYLDMSDLQPGTIQGKRKFIPAATLRVDKTRGLQMGLDFDNLTPIPDLNDATSTALVSGDTRAVIYGDWVEKGEICIQQDLPLPATILGVIVEVTAGDTSD